HFHQGRVYQLGLQNVQHRALALVGANCAAFVFSGGRCGTRSARMPCGSAERYPLVAALAELKPTESVGNQVLHVSLRQMVTPATSHLDPPKSWDELEDICADLFGREWQDNNTTRYGRQGQRQNGVDIYGRPGRKKYAGVQCKG